MLIAKDFCLHRPDSLEEALAMRGELGDEAAVYAGGTELLLAMKMGVLEYDHLIDIKGCAELRGLDVDAGKLRIGATTTHRELELSALVRHAVPALSELERHVANVRVRAAGTLGGNLAFAEPHADPAALLIALSARVRLASRSGARELPVDEFIEDAYETALLEDELLSTVIIPVPSPATRATYCKIATLERPTVGVAVVGEVVGDAFAGEPAVVVGAVDERPVRVDASALVGAGGDDDDALSAVADAARAAIDPVDDLSGSAEYKVHLTGVLVRRAVVQLFGSGDPS